jgi:hypothetical protein
MAQEFTIKSQQIEDKINQLLPSQGGFQPGVDFSASTMVIPIVDLTETAEGSNIRQDLQTSLSLDSITTFSFANTNGTIISTTGYFRVFGTSTLFSNSSQLMTNKLTLTDGITTKNAFEHIAPSTGAAMVTQAFDFIAFIKAGDSMTATSTGPSNFAQLQGNTRQIADINGNLVNP